MRALYENALFGLLGLVLGAMSCLAHADYVFQSIDYQIVNGTPVPGGSFTEIWGINDVGDVPITIGTVAAPTNFIFHPTTGTFTPLPDAPGGLLPYAGGINNAGVIAGSALTSDFMFAQGFTLVGSNYEFFSDPGWPLTFANSISNSNLVAGITATVDPNSSNLDIIYDLGVGFIYDPSTGNFTNFTIPGPSYIFSVTGINAAEQVVGAAFVPGTFSHGFLRDPNGTITLFQIDGSSTEAKGINDNGLIVGWVRPSSSGVETPFVASALGYQLLPCPTDVCTGTVRAMATAINNLGQIVGLWSNDKWATIHSFIATPASLPTGITLNGAYLFSVDVVPNATIFIDPKVALGYDYEIGDGDPLFGSVRLPFGVGDNQYTLIVGGHSFQVSANESFDFPAHGFTNGVARFRVAGIETDAALDPANASAFPTGLTFTAAGRFTGTMTPLCRPGSMPDQAQVPTGRALVACGSH